MTRDSRPPAAAAAATAADHTGPARHGVATVAPGDPPGSGWAGPGQSPGLIPTNFLDKAIPAYGLGPSQDLRNRDSTSACASDSDRD